MTSRKLEKTSEPGVYKRGGRYVVTFRDRDGRPRKRFAPTFTEAKRLRAQLRTDVQRGEYRETSRVTFADYARDWIDTYAGRTSTGIRDETRADYRKRLEQDAIPLLGRLRLSHIEAADLDRLAQRVARGPLCRSCSGQGCPTCTFKGRLDGEIAANTVRLALAPVKALLATAHQRGDLRSNPAAGYRTRYAQKRVDDGQPEDDVKALTEDEVAAFLAALSGDEEWSRWRPFFEFLAHTGLRIGEAIELRWRDVDLGKRTLRVQRRYYRGCVGPPKSRYGKRTIRLSPALAQTLWRRWADEKPADDQLVFTAAAGGRVDPSNLMSRALKPAAVKAGLGATVRGQDGKLRPESWVGFHTFRHTCATLLFRAGWNAVQVQRWLGHHKPSFTLDTYVHLLEGDVPEPTFMDSIVAADPPDEAEQVGNDRATRAAENGRDRKVGAVAG
jgi:integrase